MSGELEMLPEFMRAMLQAMEEHEKLGHIDSGDWQENGAMRAVGIARGDTLKFANALQQTYGFGLAIGWDCPACGEMLDAHGDCPDGHEFDRRGRMAAQLETLLAIVELALATGVYLERSRYGGDS